MIRVSQPHELKCVRARPVSSLRSLCRSRSSAPVFEGAPSARLKQGAEKVGPVTSAAKAGNENSALIAALKRCATPNQVSAQPVKAAPFHNIATSLTAS